MAKKSDKTEPSPQLKELERKVDVLMSTELPPEKSESAATGKKSSLKVVSDYAGNPQTAPELAPKLRKSVKTGKASAVAKTTETATKAPKEASAEPETQPEAQELEAALPSPEVPSKSIIDDAETDKAVADIVVREGDMQLAVDDAIARRKAAAIEEPHSATSGYWILLLLIIVIGTATVVYLWFR